MAKMLANELFAMEACQKLLPKKAVQKSCSKKCSPSNCCLEKAAQKRWPILLPKGMAKICYPQQAGQDYWPKS
jgi:hypothetical protein